jgi:hypothetical protein
MEMRNAVLAGLALALVACAWTLATSSSSQAAENERWEYTELQLASNASSVPAFNRLGAEGWELVNVVAACEDGAYCQWWAYLKRKL